MDGRALVPLPATGTTLHKPTHFPYSGQTPTDCPSCHDKVEPVQSVSMHTQSLTRTHARTHARTRTHTQTNTNKQTNERTNKQTNKQTHTHTHRHTQTRTHKHAQTQTRTVTNEHAHTQSFSFDRVRDTHGHTHTHTHNLFLFDLLCLGLGTKAVLAPCAQGASPSNMLLGGESVRRTVVRKSVGLCASVGAGQTQGVKQSKAPQEPDNQQRCPDGAFSSSLYF